MEDQLHNLAVFSSNENPTSYEEDVIFEVWRKAMEIEIESIERGMILGSLQHPIKA